MKYKLDERDIRVIKAIDKKFCWNTKIDEDGYVEVETLVSLIYDLKDEYDNIEDEFVEFDQNVQDNYRPIPLAEQYGISDRDFI